MAQKPEALRAKGLRCSILRDLPTLRPSLSKLNSVTTDLYSFFSGNFFVSFMLYWKSSCIWSLKISGKVPFEWIIGSTSGTRYISSGLFSLPTGSRGSFSDLYVWISLLGPILITSLLTYWRASNRYMTSVLSEWFVQFLSSWTFDWLKLSEMVKSSFFSSSVRSLIARISLVIVLDPYSDCRWLFSRYYWVQVRITLGCTQLGNSFMQLKGRMLISIIRTNFPF